MGLLSAVLLWGVLCANAQTKEVTGSWLGTLKAGQMQLRLGLHLVKGTDGALSGKMDSLDQGAAGIPMAKVVQQGTEFSFEIPVVRASFKGTVNAAADEISGVFTQGAPLPLTFRRVDAMPSTARPQEPAKPYPYEEIEVSYENTEQNIKLAGTLTVPAKKPAPAVILITGSGAQDRNETLMGHKPFLVLADYLTRRGIAVLRVDDRGVGGSSGSVSKSTSRDFATDVLAGVAFLRARPEIERAQIGLIGHSEGGVIAPIAASQSKDVAFIVLMAGTGVNGEQLLYEQGAAVMKSGGASEQTIIANREVQKKLFALLREEPDDKALAEKAKALAGEGPARMVANPWFRAFAALDPAVYLRKVTCPVLALNGELDVQVVARQNLPAIAQALEEGGNSDYTIAKLPKLNHLFQTAKTGGPGEYGTIAETLAPLALDTIANWILSHTKPKGN